MIETRRTRPRGTPLLIEVTEGHTLNYRTHLFFDLASMLRLRLAYGMAEELMPHGIAVVALTPGYMRSESVLDLHGVNESNWRDAVVKDPYFAESETPFYVGRAVAALATDPAVLQRSGGSYTSWQLAKEYGFTDVDGGCPDLGSLLAAASPMPATRFRWESSAAHAMVAAPV